MVWESSAEWAGVAVKKLSGGVSGIVLHEEAPRWPTCGASCLHENCNCFAWGVLWRACRLESAALLKVDSRTLTGLASWHVHAAAGWCSGAMAPLA